MDCFKRAQEHAVLKAAKLCYSAIKYLLKHMLKGFALQVFFFYLISWIKKTNMKTLKKKIHKTSEFTA